ncbi:hypothetical protein BD414DRAFT_494302 [Trametes punicea]|nr:hypothetical protein BD414DRAFT_494302 [Trametes punicea]
MNGFSRVIARPTNTKQRVPEMRIAESGSILGATQPTHYLQPSRAADIPSLPISSLQQAFHPDANFAALRHGYGKSIWGDQRPSQIDSHAEGFAKPFPRLFTLMRTESLCSVPSLCSDDSLAVSTRSPSPNSPQSPPPTGCSTMAALGSAGYMASFADEYDRPEADPNFIRNQLAVNWYLRRQARMRDGDFRDTDDERDYSVTKERIAQAPVAKPTATSSIHAAVHNRPGDAQRSTGPSTPKASRLSRRVKVPPPLNAAAIRAHTLLSKLLGETYDVEIGDVDGSDISGEDSGFEADDEHGYDSLEPLVTASAAIPERSSSKAAASVEATLHAGAKMDQGNPQSLAKMTYAAVVAASSRAGASSISG